MKFTDVEPYEEFMDNSPELEITIEIEFPNYEPEPILPEKHLPIPPYLDPIPGALPNHIKVPGQYTVSKIRFYLYGFAFGFERRAAID